MSLSSLQALVFIIKALIQTFQYLTGMIKEHEYHASMSAMRASIEKATNGNLDQRTQGGQEVEDRINQHAGGGK